MIAAQTFVSAEQFARSPRHFVQRAGFRFHHVLIKIRRTPDGLARIIDNKIKAIARGEQMFAKRLDARRVAQIESENFQLIFPLAKIRFL